MDRKKGRTRERKSKNKCFQWLKHFAADFPFYSYCIVMHLLNSHFFITPYPLRNLFITHLEKEEIETIQKLLQTLEIWIEKHGASFSYNHFINS